MLLGVVVRQGFLALVVASSLLGPGFSDSAAIAQQSTAVPDAPAPQQSTPAQPEPNAPTPQAPLADSISGIASQAARGKGTTDQTVTPIPADTAAPASNTQASPDGPPQQEPPYVPKDAEEAQNYIIRQNVNVVQVPVTVHDSHGADVPGLTFRDFRVYENGTRQHIDFFSADAAPLSVAFVIDQSLPRDVMGRVNNSLAAISGAFTPQDEAAIFTYADGVTKQTDFTIATGDRLSAVLVRSKATGEDMGTPDNTGPISAGPMINNKPIDPNLTPGRSNTGFITLPKPIHTLNDAILAAGEALSTAKKGRRRVIYVISDGKESRSKAGVAEVVRYLQSHQESVYATLVGESAVPYIGFIDKFHIPLLPYDNILPKYTVATGGILQAQLSTDGMQRSFAHILDQVRTQYTLGYTTHGSTLDSRYRKWDIHVEHPNLDVIAPPGYYPSASMSSQR